MLHLHPMVFVTRNFLFILFSQEIESQIDRICEMGAVMRRAVQVDDNQFCKIQEKLAQLEVRRWVSGAHLSFICEVHWLWRFLEGLRLHYRCPITAVY